MSNLLEKASILTTPTAYNDGKLLSVKPIQTEESYNVDSTDFTVDGTSGNVFYKDTLSLAGTSGVATITFNHTVLQGTRSRVYIRNGADSGYVTTYTTSDFSQGQALPNLTKQGDISVIVTFTDGLTFGFLAENGNEIQIQNFKAVEIIDGDFDFTRGSSGTRVNEQGLVENVATNLPRIDYTDGVGHILLEPQSTNLFAYSDASVGFTETRVTISNNQGISPDGTNNSTKMLMSSGTGTHRVYERISSSLNDNNTFSFFIKEQSEISHIGLTSDTATEVVWFSGLDGSIINANGLDAKTQSFLNGWHRISISYTADDNDASDNQFVYFSNRQATSPSVAFNGTETILMYGFQAEKQSFATSYIPTNGSTETRLADVCKNAGSSDLINSTEGVLYAEIAALASDNIKKGISISNGTTPNRIILRYGNQTNKIEYIIVSGGAIQINVNIFTFNILNYLKIAVKWKLNDFALWINGTEVRTDTLGITFPTDTLSELNLDSTTLEPFYGKVKCVAVFKEALTDEELTCLTTI